MRKDEIFLKEGEALHSLRVLEEIEKNPKISQRELSNQLGVALGITNALLKTLVRKGLVKIRGNNNRSLTYHLTHAGVLTKSKLAMNWTLNTVSFYRQAREGIASKLAVLAKQNVESIVLYGNVDLTEIAAIVAPEMGLRILGIVDRQTIDSEKSILGHPVIRLEQLVDTKPDAIVICEEMVDEAQMKELSRYVKSTTRFYQLI